MIFRLHRFQNAIAATHTHIHIRTYSTHVGQLYLSLPLPSPLSYWQLNCGPSFEMESNWFGWANKSGNWQLNLDTILSGSLGAWNTRCASMCLDGRAHRLVVWAWHGIVDSGFKDIRANISSKLLFSPLASKCGKFHAQLNWYKDTMWHAPTSQRGRSYFLPVYVIFSILSFIFLFIRKEFKSPKGHERASRRRLAR